MNHRTALEKKDHSGFHYVDSNPRYGAHPIGYCREHAPHPTADEARACFRTYQRDHIALDQLFKNWGDCSVHECDTPTRQGARIQGDPWHSARLCPEHLTKPYALIALDLADERVGDSWES